MRTPRCTACGRSLEEGFLVDHGHSVALAASWVAGPAEKSFWSGVKLRGRPKLPVVALRCTACGLLQLYALE